MEKTNSNTTGNKETKDLNAANKEVKEVKESKDVNPEKTKKERKPRGERRSKKSSNESESSIEGLLSVDISKPENLIEAGYSIEKLQLLYIKTAIGYLKGVK